MGAFLYVLAGLVGVLVAAIWASLRASEEAGRAEARWGEVVSSDDLRGDGAFRAARLVGHRPRGVPRIVLATGAFGVALGILSSLLVAPASLVLALFTSTATGPGSPLTLATLAVAGVSFVSGYFVYSASRGVLRCERGGGERAMQLGRLELGLHALPIALYCAILGPQSGVTLAAFALWSIGAVHGALLWAAGARVAKIQSKMSADERAALPAPASRAPRRIRARKIPAPPSR